MADNKTTPPAGSLVLTPSALAFSVAMLLVGAVGGYLVGSSKAPTPDPEPAATTAAADEAADDSGLSGTVVNNTGGTIRRLSEEEKQDLLSGRGDRNPSGTDKKDPPEPTAPSDSPWLAEGIVGTFDDAVLAAEYRRAVAFMSAGNARSAKPSLTTLKEASDGKPWAEAVSALMTSAHASVGEVREGRSSADSFKAKWPDSAWMATIVVAEGKTYMPEGKRARKPGQKRGDPLNDDQKRLYREAIQRWDDAIARFPEDAALEDALLNKSALLIELGALAEAESAAIALATKFPEAKNAPRALSNVGRSAVNSGDLETAQRIYQLLVDEFPRDRLARSARSQLESLRLLGKDAPELYIEEWLGDDLGSMADLKGKPVLLVFWATWCPHCRREMPDVEALWQKHQGELAIIAVTKHSRGQTTDKVREYLTAEGITVPVAIDTSETSRAYGVSGIPAAALIDKDGKVVFRNHPGQLDDATLAQYL